MNVDEERSGVLEGPKKPPWEGSEKGLGQSQWIYIIYKVNRKASHKSKCSREWARPAHFIVAGAIGKKRGEEWTLLLIFLWATVSFIPTSPQAILYTQECHCLESAKWLPVLRKMSVRASISDWSVFCDPLTFLFLTDGNWSPLTQQHQWQRNIMLLYFFSKSRKLT